MRAQIREHSMTPRPHGNGKGGGRGNQGDSTLAAIYVRVSSKEQVEGYSLDAQRRACRELCASRGYQVVAE
jgi:hypothetical protein